MPSQVKEKIKKVRDLEKELHEMGKRKLEEGKEITEGEGAEGEGADGERMLSLREELKEEREEVFRR